MKLNCVPSSTPLSFLSLPVGPHVVKQDLMQSMWSFWHVMKLVYTMSIKNSKQKTNSACNLSQ